MSLSSAQKSLVVLACLFCCLSAVQSSFLSSPNAFLQTSDKACGALGCNEKCHPGCKWRCTNPECPAKCSPVCESPRCHIMCTEPAPKCTVECSPPACEVKCPNVTCAANDCPQCTTQCSAPVCTTKCAKCEPQCETHCEDVKCNWNCQKPQNCSVPQCELACENPSCLPQHECCKCTKPFAGTPAPLVFLEEEANPNCCSCKDAPGPNYAKSDIAGPIPVAPVWN